LKAKKYLIYSFLTLITGVCIYGFFVEPDDIEVHQLQINGSVFGKAMKGMTAVHISDLHMSRTGAREKVVLRIIDDVKPDIIFLTGDYVKWDDDYEPALNFLSQLKAKVGVWAVMGDYDYSNSRKSCLFCHEPGTGKKTKRYEVRFLKDFYEDIQFPNGTIQLYGVDNDDNGEGSDKKIETKDSAIILSHSPLAFDKIDNNKDILMLAGDTHGGQIPLPSWFWRLIGYDKNAKYNHGLFKEGRKMMYVSRGIGTSHIPFRFFERPEVVVIRF
jgi:uncharacterized protein